MRLYNGPLPKHLRIYRDQIAGFDKAAKKPFDKPLMQCRVHGCQRKFSLQTYIDRQNVVCEEHRFFVFNNVINVTQSHCKYRDQVSHIETQYYEGLPKRSWWFFCSASDCKTPIHQKSFIGQNGYCRSCRAKRMAILGHPNESEAVWKKRHLILSVRKTASGRTYEVKCCREKCINTTYTYSSARIDKKLCMQCARRRATGTKPFESIFNRTRASALARRKVFKLSFKQFSLLCRCLTCFYCHGPMGRVAFTTKGPQNGVLGGMDRVDNKKGYIRNNVVPCCKNCNNLKGHCLTAAETLAVIALRKRKAGSVRLKSPSQVARMVKKWQDICFSVKIPARLPVGMQMIR